MFSNLKIYRIFLTLEFITHLLNYTGTLFFIFIFVSHFCNVELLLLQFYQWLVHWRLENRYLDLTMFELRSPALWQFNVKFQTVIASRLQPLSVMWVVCHNCLELQSIKSHFFMDVYKICTTSVDLGYGPLRGSGLWTPPTNFWRWAFPEV